MPICFPLLAFSHLPPFLQLFLALLEDVDHVIIISQKFRCSFYKLSLWHFSQSSSVCFMLLCGDIGIDDEDATKFIYNNGNNASTDNITAGVAA